MCGRYKLEDRIDFGNLHEIVEQLNRREDAGRVKTSGEIFPTDVVPVVADSRRRAPGVFAMEWGYGLRDGRRVINARSETALDRPLFRDGMRYRRCAVPATGYFEWARAGGRRTKYSIHPDAGGLFYMAGIYRLEAGRPEFVILTRAPAEAVAFIHDRMPVILPGDLVEDWTDPDRRAEEILEHAVLDVTPTPEEDGEQLRMVF